MVALCSCVDFRASRVFSIMGTFRTASAFKTLLLCNRSILASKTYGIALTVVAFCNKVNSLDNPGLLMQTWFNPSNDSSDLHTYCTLFCIVQEEMMLNK